MHNTKSQMEIFGLAVVVVLILLAATFVVKFMINQKPADQRKNFVDSELASNMLNSFLKTTASECSKLSMTELLQYCAQGIQFTCADPEESDSCKYVDSAARKIFAETLDRWKYNYEFFACADFDSKTLQCIDSSSKIIGIGKPCPAQKKSKIYHDRTKELKKSSDSNDKTQCSGSYANALTYLNSISSASPDSIDENVNAIDSNYNSLKDENKKLEAFSCSLIY